MVSRPALYHRGLFNDCSFHSTINHYNNLASSFVVVLVAARSRVKRERIEWT